METSRRNQLVLGALVLALLGVVYVNWPKEAGTSGPSSQAVQRKTASPATVGGGESVRLNALKSERPELGTIERNLFRFKARPVAASGPGRGAPPPPPVAAVAPPAPAGPPPIAMKFIGLVESPLPAQRIAVLSDVRGVYEGREGDVIEGRYRIMRIGQESIEMAYLDGRGRQTIRLSGS